MPSDFDLMHHRATKKPAPVVGEIGGMERFLAPVHRSVTFPAHETHLEELRKLAKKEDSSMSKYIVWSPQSASAPTIVHMNRPDAINAAGAMAHRYPGQEFFVCKLTNRAFKSLPVPVPSVTYTDLEKE